MRNSESTNVVTGQQLGLLGGPLYTTYKVLGAIRRAEKIGGKAIFWLGTNDSDFDEIKSIRFLDANGELRQLEWPHEPTEGLSCGLLVVDGALRDQIEEFFASLRQTEFTPRLKELALNCYVGGIPLGKASALLANELFGKFDLRIFDPMEDDFKSSSQPVLLKEAVLTEDGVQGNFFVVEGGKRTAVFRKVADWVTRNGRKIELDKFLLVPNVKTRNVCQDLYFKTHTYVAGPGEIKYIAELDDVYARHGARKARIEKRMSITLIEPNVKRKLDKLNVGINEVVDVDNDKFVKNVFLRHSSIDFEEIEREIENHTATFLEQVKANGIDSTPAFEKDIMKSVKALIGKRRGEEKARLAAITKQAASVSSALYPFNTHQERVFTVFQYMNLYGGLEFIDQLYENYDVGRTVLGVGSVNAG